MAINVPTIIMGLTFLAAGSTLPEAVSSVISLRNGKTSSIKYNKVVTAFENGLFKSFSYSFLAFPTIQEIIVLVLVIYILDFL